MMLTIRTLGLLSVEGFLIKPKGARHTRALLAILATRHGKPVPRSYLADLLWGTDRARSSLSQLLYTLKASVPLGVVIVSDTHVTLSEKFAEADCSAFLRAIKEGRDYDAIELYFGPFLDGANYITDQFDDWRLAKAAEYEQLVKAALDGLINEALGREDHHTAAVLAKRALVVFPLNERLARTHCDLLAVTGDVSKAIIEAERFRRSYLSETGRQPADITEAYVRDLAKIPPRREERGDARIHLPLVGRSTEILRLRDHAHAAQSGCRVAVVTGEGGIGKSRLVQHATRRSVLDGARAFAYTCSEVEGRLPYSALVGLLREGFRTGDLDNILDPWRAALGSFAPELFPDAPQSAVPSQRFLWEAVAQYFDFIAKAAPVTIAVDNAHWIDENSKEVLIYVSKRLAERPLQIIYAGRGLTQLPIYEDSHDIAILLELRALEPDGALELIGRFEAANSLDVPAQLKAELLRRIGGRPFYLLQALREIKRLPIMPESPDAPEAASLLSNKLPEIVASRLATLPDAARSLIAAAAILNREAPLQLLARVAEVPLLMAADIVSELVNQGILAEATDVRFAHDLMRDGALACVRSSHRPVWHLRVAETISSTKSGTANEIAFHYEEAGELEKAYSFAYRAASEAMRLYAYSDAEAHYKRMIRCAPEDQSVDALLEFVRFCARSARYSKLLPVLTRAEKACRERADNNGVVTCALARFYLLESEERVELEDIVAQARNIVHLAEIESPIEISNVMWVVADHIKRWGDFESLAHFARMLASQSADAQQDAAAEMLSVAALLSAFSINLATARPLAESAVTTAELTSDNVLLARTLYARGTVHLWDGELLLAARDYERAFTIAKDSAPDNLIQNLLSNSAVLYMEQGRYSEAEQNAKMALEATPSAKRAYHFGNLALISFRRGDLDMTMHYLHALLRTNEVSPQPWIPAHAAALMGLVDLAKGDLSSAEARAAIAKESIDVAHGVGDTSHIHVLCAKVDFELGNRDRAMHRVREAARDLLDRDFICGARVQLEWARMALASGVDVKEAREAAASIEAAGRAKGAVLLMADAAEVLSGSYKRSLSSHASTIHSQPSDCLISDGR